MAPLPTATNSLPLPPSPLPPLPFPLQILHSMSETGRAVDVLRLAPSAHHDSVDDEAINLLVELLMVSKQYNEAFEVRQGTAPGKPI